MSDAQEISWNWIALFTLIYVSGVVVGGPLWPYTITKHLLKRK